MTMTGYTKLFSSIVHSTIWRAPDHIRLVWITMLALANRDGIVEASVPGLADAARVTLEQCEEALVSLSSPDIYSRTRDHEGRRIAEAPGGWLLLNYRIYRDRMSAEHQRELARLRKRRQREREASDVTECHADVTPVTKSHNGHDKQKQRQKQKQDQDPTDPLSDKQSDGAGEQLALSPGEPAHDPVKETWERFCRERKAAHPGCRKLTLTPARRAHIRARLKSHGPGDIELAIRNYFDPRFFWAQHGHASPDLVFRSAEQLEKVRDAKPRDGDNGKPTAPAPAYHKPFVPPTSLSVLTKDIGNGGSPPSRGAA